jgi:hypothetical protein
LAHFCRISRNQTPCAAIERGTLTRARFDPGDFGTVRLALEKRGYRMKKIIAIASAAVLGLGVAACDSAAENAAEDQAEATEQAVDAQADAMESAAQGTATEEAVENQADAMRESADQAADAAEDRADATDGNAMQGAAGQ